MQTDPEDMKNAIDLPPIDWSMHQPDEKCSTSSTLREIEDGEVEIISVEIVPD